MRQFFLAPITMFNSIDRKEYLFYAKTFCLSTHYLIKTPFDAFANREDPDQEALVRAA